eukprot:TRINITY_DN41449_c0_g1_i1.p1 TRINITY_DN41449_c0_g1~~TRINITY_DN41449_c0_g1_i1.p1  ORF type:complete len:645 (+),score=60.13 TRINITY_DN41449_c0_g1_i1:65-1999(+)
MNRRSSAPAATSLVSSLKALLPTHLSSKANDAADMADSSERRPSKVHGGMRVSFLRKMYQQSRMVMALRHETKTPDQDQADIDDLEAEEVLTEQAQAEVETGSSTILASRTSSRSNTKSKGWQAAMAITKGTGRAIEHRNSLVNKVREVVKEAQRRNRAQKMIVECLEARYVNKLEEFTPDLDDRLKNMLLDVSSLKLPDVSEIVDLIVDAVANDAASSNASMNLLKDRLRAAMEDLEREGADCASLESTLDGILSQVKSLKLSLSKAVRVIGATQMMQAGMAQESMVSNLEENQNDDLLETADRVTCGHQRNEKDGPIMACEETNQGQLEAFRPSTMAIESVQAHCEHCSQSKSASSIESVKPPTRPATQQTARRPATQQTARTPLQSRPPTCKDFVCEVPGDTSQLSPPQVSAYFAEPASATATDAPVPVQLHSGEGQVQHWEESSEASILHATTPPGLVGADVASHVPHALGEQTVREEVQHPEKVIRPTVFAAPSKAEKLCGFGDLDLPWSLEVCTPTTAVINEELAVIGSSPIKRELPRRPSKLRYPPLPMFRPQQVTELPPELPDHRLEVQIAATETFPAMQSCYVSDLSAVRLSHSSQSRRSSTRRSTTGSISAFEFPMRRAPASPKHTPRKRHIIQ